MNDVLFIGNIKTVTNGMLNAFQKNQKIILCGETSVKEFENKKVSVYPFRESDKEYRGIFQSYNFSTVIYFSKVLDGHKRLYDEMESLENALYSAVLSGVDNFIYLTTNDYDENQRGNRARLLQTCEEICRNFVDENNINVMILRVPYMYSVEETESNLAEVIKNAIKQKKIVLDGAKHQVTDFINDADLGSLLVRIHDEPLSGFRRADITGGNEMEFESVAEFLSSATGVSEIDYREYKDAIPVSSNDGSMRQLFGWFPTHLLEDDIPDVVDEIEKNTATTKVKKVHRIRNEKIRNILQIAVEMIFTFAIAELLTAWTQEFYRMDYVDFRLMFVVIMGTMHGIGAGITASLLACVGYFWVDLSQTNLEIVFFNIENWLPFAAYFLSGTIVGHIRDRNKENLRFLGEQQEILESKYNFLSDLYNKTLENKEEFSKQIIGYEDSFGKLYQVVGKLNSTVADHVFLEAVFAFEEILKTTSAAIYTIGANSHFARLNVCSREVNEKLSKSMDLAKYPKLEEALRTNQNWYNAEGLVDYPVYAAPVWENGQLYGAILIWSASAAQMKMDFFNKFSILSGLIQDALVRAIEYGEQQASVQMIENTKIMKAQYFEEILSVKEKMGKEGMSDYMLLEVVAQDMSLTALGEIITSGIRNTDTIGMREDKKIYLLLNQTNDKSLDIVRSRLEPKGIKLLRQ